MRGTAQLTGQPRDTSDALEHGETDALSLEPHFPDDGCSCALQLGSGEAEELSLLLPVERHVGSAKQAATSQSNGLTALDNC